MGLWDQLDLPRALFPRGISTSSRLTHKSETEDGVKVDEFLFSEDAFQVPILLGQGPQCRIQIGKVVIRRMNRDVEHLGAFGTTTQQLMIRGKVQFHHNLLQTRRHLDRLKAHRQNREEFRALRQVESEIYHWTFSD